MNLFDKLAEECVIGAVFGEPSIVADVMDIVNADDFYVDDNKKIFAEIMNLFNKGSDIDVMTVSAELNKSGAGNWVSHIAQMVSNTPTFVNGVTYAETVREFSIRRRISETCKSTMNKLTSNDAYELLNEMQNNLMQIDAHDETNRTHTSKTATAENKKVVFELMKNKKHKLGILTGLYSLDQITSGLNKGDLIIVAARPSVGKSSLATQIMLSCIAQQKVPLMFSLEMSTREVTNRLISGSSKIPLGNIRNGMFNNDDAKSYTEAADDIGSMSWGINDSGDITVGKMRAEALKFKQRHGLDLIIIDYLQLINPGSSRENRQNQISQISRSLKILAKDFEIPILVLSQLSRASEMEKREPKLSDLRDSGAIEQDADIVIFLHRYMNGTQYYHKCIVAKNRNGSIGSFDILFNNNTTTFREKE